METVKHKKHAWYTMPKMHAVFQWVEGHRKIMVVLFFLLFLSLGVSIFDNYGITWDEVVRRQHGLETYATIFHIDATAVDLNPLPLTKRMESSYQRVARYYGPVFEVGLVMFERLLGLTDTQQIFLMRHLATFLMFYIGVVFFYFLCTRQYRSSLMGLLGCLMLILHPRIFAHSFYNSKDIVFLSFFIISIVTMVRYLDRMTIQRAAVHALACALLIDVRVLGVLVPILTIIGMGVHFAIHGKRFLLEQGGMVARSWAVYVILLPFLTVLFWPFLWSNPVRHILEALGIMAAHPTHISLYYFGERVSSQLLPWHYAPVWILISTPVAYTVLFALGVVDAAKTLWGPSDHSDRERNIILFLLWFSLPLIMVIFLGSTLYNGWRQLFFIYPALVLLSLRGLETLLTKLRQWRWTLALALTMSFASTALFMVRNHPHENVYFNTPLMEGVREAANLFALDYWGSSYRQALEYILQTDNSPIVKVYTRTDPGEYTRHILPADDRKRLQYVERDEAAYLLIPRDLHTKELPSAEEIYSVKVDGVNIMIVYKR
jgi:hypothetical protein